MARLVELQPRPRQGLERGKQAFAKGVEIKARTISEHAQAARPQLFCKLSCVIWVKPRMRGRGSGRITMYASAAAVMTRAAPAAAIQRGQFFRRGGRSLSSRGGRTA